jgi:hypothetical protein
MLISKLLMLTLKNYAKKLQAKTMRILSIFMLAWFLGAFFKACFNEFEISIKFCFFDTHTVFLLPKIIFGSYYFLQTLNVTIYHSPF